MSAGDPYYLRVLLAIDRLANALLGGDDTETISSRSGRHVGDSDIASALAVLLDVVDDDHVFDALDAPEAQKALLRTKLAAWKALCVVPPREGDPQAS